MRRSAVMMDEQPAREMPQRDDDSTVAAHREAAAAKRLAARRRFLLGSGGALSAMVTISPGRAGAVAHPECAAGMDWMTMSLEARNLAFNNVAHVGPDFARQKTESWAAASQALREQRPEHLDLAYAPGERTKWDLYPATDPKAPCFVHIHGGYWQRGSKETFACLAEGALAHGWAAALPGYTLAPEASLTQITDELRTAFDWLDAEAAEHGIEGPVIVTGWSAGGHLTAFIWIIARWRPGCRFLEFSTWRRYAILPMSTTRSNSPSSRSKPSRPCVGRASTSRSRSRTARANYRP